MKLNHQIKYGVQCLCELAKTQGEFIGAESIATAQNIPTSFAHKVLQKLAHSGLVISHKRLGYKLARPLADISALDLFDSFAPGRMDEIMPSNPSATFENKINKALNTVSLGNLIS